jgi:hypothetical protein
MAVADAAVQISVPRKGFITACGCEQLSHQITASMVTSVSISGFVRLTLLVCVVVILWSCCMLWSCCGHVVWCGHVVCCGQAVCCDHVVVTLYVVVML